MPIYEYNCDCGFGLELIQSNGGSPPVCPECEREMIRKFPIPAMVKMDGFYPARKKFLDGSAPGTTNDVTPWGNYDPSKPKWMSSDARKRQLTVEEVKALV